jgi:hypothetical protein
MWTDRALALPAKRAGATMAHRATSVNPVPGRSRESYQSAGRSGGLIKNALAVDRKGTTRAAREKAFQKFLDQVPAEVTDPADRIRRAEMLRTAHMIQLSMRAATARTRAAAERRKADQAEADLDALRDAG